MLSGASQLTSSENESARGGIARFTNNFEANNSQRPVALHNLVSKISESGKNIAHRTAAQFILTFLLCSNKILRWF